MSLSTLNSDHRGGQYMRANLSSPAPELSSRSHSPSHMRVDSNIDSPEFSSAARFDSSAQLNSMPPSDAPLLTLPPTKKTQSAKKRRNIIIISLIALLAIIGAIIGLSVGLTRKASDKNLNNAQSSQSTTSASSSPSSPNEISRNRTPLKRWDFSTMKSFGVNLGCWFLLELWMNEGFVIKTIGPNPNVTDEWSFMQAMDAKGINKTEVMLNYYNTFITESDIEFLYQAGVNKVRIPMGFWMWIPCEGDEPYVCQNGQIEALERALPWLADRGIHVDLDLHGLPGSQAPDAQTTGHRTPWGQDAWFQNEHNLNRTLVMVKNIINWIENSPYQDIIAGLEAVNEPRLFRPEELYDSDMQFLKRYYDIMYDMILASKWKGWLLFHTAYAKDMVAEWQPYALNKSATGRIVLVDHPYAGNYPPKNETATQKLFCDYIITGYKKFNNACPILANEYSLVSGVFDDKWTKNYYHMQQFELSKYAGSVFWSIKTFVHLSQRLVAPDPHRVRVYSFQNVIKMGVIPKAPHVNSTGVALADGASEAAQKIITSYFESLGPSQCDGSFSGVLATTSSASLGAVATN